MKTQQEQTKESQDGEFFEIAIKALANGDKITW